MSDRAACRHAGLVAALLALSVMAGAPARAQQSATPPAAPLPAPAELEPGVDTSATSASAKPAAAATDKTSAAPASAPAATAAPGKPAAASRDAPQNGAQSAPGALKSGTKKVGPDRVELETTDITGNRELPKVLYIVPWKHSDLGDLVGKPTNSLLDEVLQPLDRDVFRRENRYYEALKPSVPGVTAAPAPLSGAKP